MIKEILYSIKYNKIRSILSGFGVFWGITIIYLLLGVSNGFQASVMGVFSSFAQRSIYVYGGVTSEKYKNFKEGRVINFDLPILEKIKNRFSEVLGISPVMSITAMIKNGSKTSNCNLFGISEDYTNIRILKVRKKGRIFNNRDIQSERNVAIIGENVEKMLFGNKEALHKLINISGILYKIIGVLKNDDIFSADDINSVYIPYPNFINQANKRHEFNSFCLYMEQKSNPSAVEEELHNYLSHLCNFSVKDKQAIYLGNLETQIKAFESLFSGINKMIWLFGISLLISGIAGIGNIIYVAVKERTNEIGIRLAVGALPRSIVGLILIESMIITVVSGLVGLLLGKSILLCVDWILLNSDSDMFIEKTIIDDQTIIISLLSLILAGVIAGIIPAIKASNIEPMEAIRHENRG